MRTRPLDACERAGPHVVTFGQGGGGGNERLETSTHKLLFSVPVSARAPRTNSEMICSSEPLSKSHVSAAKFGRTMAKLVQTWPRMAKIDQI